MTQRAAIYARYSSDLQKPTSIADQVAMARRFCEEKGWTVVVEHSDSEMTGKNMRRPGFNALKKDIRANRVDVVVVEAIDRMTRRVVDALSSYEMLQFSGVTLYSVSEGKQDFMKVLLLGYGAQLYSQSIAPHTERGRRAALENQHRLHSVSYGYRAIEAETGPNREIDPEQAAIVRRIFEETAEGRSSLEIAWGLNRDGIPSPKGAAWSDSIIRGNVARREGILRNTLYIGRSRYGATHRQNDPETGARKVTATPDKLLEVEIPELRILPQELWDAAQARMAQNGHKVAGAGNARAAHRTRYLLSGLMVCGCCGAPYVMRGKDRYGCRGNRDGLCTNNKTIRRDRIEARVFKRLRRFLLTPELSARFEKAIAAERRKLQSDDSGARLKALKQ